MAVVGGMRGKGREEERWIGDGEDWEFVCESDEGVGECVMLR